MAVRHVVLFKFKPEVDAKRVAELVAAFVALKDTIDVVEALEWGTDMSPEGLQDGFTHCFYLTFADAAARDAHFARGEGFADEASLVLDAGEPDVVRDPHRPG